MVKTASLEWPQGKIWGDRAEDLGITAPGWGRTSGTDGKKYLSNADVCPYT